MARLMQVVDKLVLGDHFYLQEKDECFYHGEYTARKGFAFSDTNKLIYNLKKSPTRKGRPEWQYKVQAIEQSGRIFRKALHPDTIGRAIFVPMPPSKAKDDPEYDDRMLQVLKSMGNDVDIRELLFVSKSDTASHERNDRPSPEELYENCLVDEGLVEPRKDLIIVADDVLTTGAHFIAAKRRLLQAYPGARVVGLFVARRVPETIEWDQIDNL